MTEFDCNEILKARKEVENSLRKEAINAVVDNVHQPPHYTYGDIEVIDYIEQVTKDEVVKKLGINKNYLDSIANNRTKKREADAYERNGYSKRMVAVKVSIAELQKELGVV